MDEQDLKNKIKASYEDEAPNLFGKIKATCANISQEPKITAHKRKPFNFILKRAIACAACLLLFALGISFGSFFKEGANQNVVNTQVDSYVYLDVNPSIELQINSEDKIISCIAGNEDAEIILGDLSLDEVDMNTALTAIVGSMYLNGYLSADSNSILVSVSSENEQKKEALLTDITNKINDVFEKSDMECSIIAQGISVDGELQKRADENGVSVGKMFFVEKMLQGEGKDQMNAQELSKMSIRELNLMYSTGDNEIFDKDVSSGEIGGYINKDNALEAVLGKIELSRDEVSEHTIKAECSFEDGSRRMVYEISIKLEQSDEIFKYTVDCTSGEIIKGEKPTINPPIGDAEPDGEADLPMQENQNEEVMQPNGSQEIDTPQKEPIQESDPYPNPEENFQADDEKDKDKSNLESK